jgi:hypothetical protein
MQPIDYRNATFETIKCYLAGQRMQVYEGYRVHGPCTTRELSQRIQMSILSLRPRTTELVELGFLTCVGPAPDPHEGIYMILPYEKVLKNFENKKREAIHAEQMQLF